MQINILSDSLLSLFLGLRLQNKQQYKLKIFYFQNKNKSLRSFPLEESYMQLLRNELGKQGIDYRFLLKDERRFHESRYTFLDEEELEAALYAAVSASGSIDIESSTELPAFEVNPSEQWILDLSEDKLALWEGVYFDKNSQSQERALVFEKQVLLFPNESRHKNFTRKMGHFEGVSYFIEMNKQRGLVLSLFGSSKISVENAFAAFASGKKGIPLALQALFLTHPKQKELNQKIHVGVNPCRPAGQFLLGRSIGVYPGLYSMHFNEGFADLCDLDRLLGSFSSKRQQKQSAIIQDWNQALKQKFISRLSYVDFFYKRQSSPRAEFYHRFLRPLVNQRWQRHLPEVFVPSAASNKFRSDPA